MKITLPSISTSLDLSRFLSQSMSFSFSRISVLYNEPTTAGVVEIRRRGGWRRLPWESRAQSPHRRWVAAGAAARTHRGIGITSVGLLPIPTLSHLYSRGYCWRRSPGRSVPDAPLPTEEVSALWTGDLARPALHEARQGCAGGRLAHGAAGGKVVQACTRRQGVAPSMVVSSVYSMLIFSQPSCLYINRMCLLLFAGQFWFRFSIIASEFESNFDLWFACKYVVLQCGARICSGFVR
jgi:hypothetical protein